MWAFVGARGRAFCLRWCHYLRLPLVRPLLRVPWLNPWCPTLGARAFLGPTGRLEWSALAMALRWLRPLNAGLAADPRGSIRPVV